jgi:hypothetical protein
MLFTVIVSMTMANRYFGGWPFDNACAANTTIPLLGTANGTVMYEFCDRGSDILLYSAREKYSYWTKDQSLVVTTFKWIAAGLMATVALYYLLWASALGIRSLLWGGFDPDGTPTDIAFTDVDEIQVRSALAPLAALAALAPLAPLTCC